MAARGGTLPSASRLLLTPSDCFGSLPTPAGRWDAALGCLCKGYRRVCLLGDSMGGTAALRFARHATANGCVVSLVPQVRSGLLLIPPSVSFCLLLSPSGSF